MPRAQGDEKENQKSQKKEPSPSVKQLKQEGHKATHLSSTKSSSSNPLVVLPVPVPGLGLGLVVVTRWEVSGRDPVWVPMLCEFCDGDWLLLQVWKRESEGCQSKRTRES